MSGVTERLQVVLRCFPWEETRVFDAEGIVSGLIRGALGGRGKSHRHTRRAFDAGLIVNPGTILTAAGVAWGLFETWQQQQGQKAAGPAASAVADPVSSGPTAPPPLPGAVASSASEETGLPPSILQLLRLMISAARADGEIAPAERERILAEAREVGAGAVVERELLARHTVAEIVAGVDDPEAKQQLYALAFTIVRADEALTGGERIYLAELARRLGLDPASVSRIEGEVARRIEEVSAAQD